MSKYEIKLECDGCFEIWRDGELFAQAIGGSAETDKANAEHIVKCVNAHPVMLEALKLADYDMELWIKAAPDSVNSETVGAIKAAIKTAGEVCL